MSISPAVPISTSCAVARSNSAALGAAGGVSRAEACRPHQPEHVRSRLCQHRDVVTDLEAARVGAALGHDHLSIARRLAAGCQLPRAQRTTEVVHAEGRRTLSRVADGITVGIDELGERLHNRLRLCDAVHASNRFEGRIGDSPPLFAAEVHLDARRRSDDGVGVVVDVGEEVVERAPNRVGEDQGAREEGDPERHCKSRADQPSLASEDTPQGEREHVSQPAA